MTPKPSRASRVFGYTRVSTSEQARHGDSLLAQRLAIIRHAKSLGKKLEHVYTDQGVSGSKPLETRQGGGRPLLQAIKSGAIQAGDVVVASKLDRMFRSARDAHNVAAIFKARKISLSLLDLLGGADVAADGMAEAFFGIAAVFARLEASRISERIRDVKFVHRSQKKFLGGHTPFGYRNVRGHVEKDPTEQQAITLIHRLRRAVHRPRWSLRRIAEAVERRFPGLRKGQGISHTTVAEVLTRPR